MNNRGAQQFVTSIYIGNLPNDITKNDLHDLCSRFGTIKETEIIPRRGIAFVKFKTKDDAAAAIYMLNGKSYYGETIFVEWARPKPEDEERKVSRDNIGTTVKREEDKPNKQQNVNVKATPNLNDTPQQSNNSKQHTQQPQKEEHVAVVQEHVQPAAVQTTTLDEELEQEQTRDDTQEKESQNRKNRKPNNNNKTREKEIRPKPAKTTNKSAKWVVKQKFNGAPNSPPTNTTQDQNDDILNDQSPPTSEQPIKIEQPNSKSPVPTANYSQPQAISIEPINNSTPPNTGSPVKSGPEPTRQPQPQQPLQFSTSFFSMGSPFPQQPPIPATPPYSAYNNTSIPPNVSVPIAIPSNPNSNVGPVPVVQRTVPAEPQEERYEVIIRNVNTKVESRVAVIGNGVHFIDEENVKTFLWPIVTEMVIGRNMNGLGSSNLSNNKYVNAQSQQQFRTYENLNS